MDESVIKINRLCKKFGDAFAVKDSNMNLEDYFFNIMSGGNASC